MAPDEGVGTGGPQLSLQAWRPPGTESRSARPPGGQEAPLLPAPWTDLNACHLLRATAVPLEEHGYAGRTGHLALPHVLACAVLCGDCPVS